MAQWLDEFDQLIWSDKMTLANISPIRGFEKCHSLRRYFSSYALKRHVEVRLEDMTRRLLHLRRIRKCVQGHELVVALDFEKHAELIVSRYEWALYVLRNPHL